MAKIKALRSCTLTTDMSYRDLAILAPWVHEKLVPKGSWMFKRGDASDGLIILAKGRIRLSGGVEGDDHLDLSAGAFLGEASLLVPGLKREVSALAVEECEILKMGAQDFSKLQEKAPDVSGKLTRRIAADLVLGFDPIREEVSELLGKSFDFQEKSGLTGS